jgi:hypothetical protein
VHELYYPLGGGGWAGGDLTAVTGGPAAVAGSALTSWADARYQHVIFLSADQHVHELYYPLAGGSWAVNDLTSSTGSPAAAAGSALTSWADARYQHVIFVSADQHVHELRFPLAGGVWAGGDLTSSTGSAAAAVCSPLTSWADASYQHVIFLSADQHVHELYFPLAGGVWVVNDLTASTGSAAAAADSTLTSWADPNIPHVNFVPAKHVIFVSADQHVHELHCPLG